MNPYEVLGVSPDATDDEIKAAYRALARKYHPDNYSDNPLSDLAQEKMKEINEAYDTIVRQRQAGGHSASGGASSFSDVRMMIMRGQIIEAETILDGIPESGRTAEWHYLKAQVLYRKGWLEDAFSHMATACQMDPNNMEYRSAMNQMNARRQNGGYAQNQMGATGCGVCDICTGMLCADCLCQCCGGRGCCG